MTKCLDCGGDYDALMACDLVIPREQWLQINPEDGGVLCANCMLGRAAEIPGTVNITGIITTGDNSLEVYRREAALHSLRVEFAYAMLQEFPMHGADALHMMAARGLCTQEQANVATAEAENKIALEDAAREIEYAAPAEVEGEPIAHPVSQDM